MPTIRLLSPSRRRPADVERMEIYDILHTLLAEGHETLLVSCGAQSVMELTLTSRGQAGIVRQDHAVMPKHGRRKNPCIAYRTHSNGVIEKYFVSRWFGKLLVWRKVRFKAHEAEELLSTLIEYSLQHVNA